VGVVTGSVVATAFVLGMMMGVVCGYSVVPDVVAWACLHLIEKQEQLEEENRQLVGVALEARDEAEKMRDEAEKLLDEALGVHESARVMNEQVTAAIEARINELNKQEARSNYAK